MVPGLKAFKSFWKLRVTTDAFGEWWFEGRHRKIKNKKELSSLPATGICRLR